MGLAEPGLATPNFRGPRANVEYVEAKTGMIIASRIVHVGRNEVAQIRAGTAQLAKRPKFRQCWRLLVPAYTLHT